MDKKQKRDLENKLQKLIIDYQKSRGTGEPDFEYIKTRLRTKLNDKLMKTMKENIQNIDNFVTVIKNENQINKRGNKTKMLLAYIKSDEVIDAFKNGLLSGLMKKDDDDDFKKEVKDILLKQVIKPLCKDLKHKSKKNQDLKQDNSAKTSAKKTTRTGFLPNISNISGSLPNISNISGSLPNISNISKKLKPNIKMFKKSQKTEEKCEKLKLEILIALVELYENNELEKLETFENLKNIMKPKITSQDDFGTEQVNDALLEKKEDTGINQSVRNMYTKIYEKIVGNL